MIKRRTSDIWLNLSQLEPVRCNLCGADDTDCFETISRFKIPLRSVLCKKCGLMYLNPRMSAAQYSEFYRETYRSFIRSNRTFEEIFDLEMKEGGEMLNFCREILKPGHSVLEIGCGPGGILCAMQSAGMDVHGVEPSLKESEFARARGIPVESKMLEELEPKNGVYDLVILSRSLNHFADPSGALEKIHSLLKPGGSVMLRLLDFPMQCHFAPVHECSQADHLYMFCQETAEAMLASKGFEILRMNPPMGWLPGFLNLWMKPKYHTMILARKTTNASSSRFADAGKIRARLERSKRFYFWRSLGYLSTYRHWLAVLIGLLLGQKTLQTLKQWKKQRTGGTL